MDLSPPETATAINNECIPPPSPTDDIFKMLGLRGGGGADHGEDGDIDGNSPEDDLSSNDEESADELGGRRKTGAAIPNGTLANEFQPGAIVRVSVNNFVTYEHADFFPGPHLNMVIGPNGTGKSSLVCAICLGLGYHSNVLGRASSFGEFVKHGKSHAMVEIELQKKRKDPENWVIRLRVNREDNSRKFWINGTETTLKNVQKLARHLKIQIDNLCQFLPQDKVAEFAGLNSVDLLAKTLQAAAPQRMIEWQNDLKGLFVQQKEVEGQLAVVTDKLKKEESRQQNLQQDVQRLREREDVQTVIDNLQDARLMVEYSNARLRYEEAKKKKKEVVASLQKLERECGPALEAVNRKQEYHARIAAFLDDRKKALRDAENAADEVIDKIEAAKSDLTACQNKYEAEAKGFDTKKQDLQRIRTKVTNLEAQLKHKPREFSAADWNTKIREQEHLRRDLQAELRENTEEQQKIIERGREKRAEIEGIKTDIKDLESQQGQKLSLLRKIHPDAARGWEWIQENQNQFSKEVFGPPMLTCSVKDERYSDLVQAVLQLDDFLCFTTQTKEDHKKLSDQFYKTMGLTVTVRTCRAPLETFRAPLPRDRLGSLGLDGYIVDYLEGPEPVLAMLCAERRLHASGIALRDVTEPQYEQLVASEVINSWAAGRHSYRVMRRKEYGAGAVSTTTKNVRKGRFWTDQPVDAAEKAELRRKLAEAEDQIRELKEHITKLKDDEKQLNDKEKEFIGKIDELRHHKNELQKAYNEYMGIGPKLESERHREQERRQEMEDARARMKSIEVAKDKATLATTRHILAHTGKVAIISKVHEELLEVRVRLIEANSDLQSLKDQNTHISQKLEDGRKVLDDVNASMEPLRAAAKRALDKAADTIGGDDERRRSLVTIANRYETVEGLDADIDAEKSKLELIHAANPLALREFEDRVVEIERLTRLKAQKDEELAATNDRITSIREQWEPQLDDLVGRINEAFSYNFEQISCAGEVGVYKDEDFDKWAIEIKVKFRENETLQRLDQHRQSGGERAVSTIFYLMSLQSMAQAPFRVVDEINQGMDPRNERMVHERMVEIACREHTSQYFLITPKLLSGLRYDERMRVLCIASGEHMPDEGRRIDFAKCARIRKALKASARG